MLYLGASRIPERMEALSFSFHEHNQTIPPYSSKCVENFNYTRIIRSHHLGVLHIANVISLCCPK